MKWTTIVPVCLRESVLGEGPHPLRGMATPPPPVCTRRMQMSRTRSSP